jgi:hypothetical protein
MIINNYGELLNSLQTTMQIICKSEEYNIHNYDIKDPELYKFIDNYSHKNNIMNKSFYIVLHNKSNRLLDSNINIISKYLKNMNIECQEIKDEFKYNKILSMTKFYVKDEEFYNKTLVVNNWPYYCTAGWLDFLYNSDLNIDINCFINPQNSQKAVKYLRKKLIQYGVNSDMELERTSDDGVYTNQLESVTSMLDELRSNQGKLFLASYYITIKGKTLDQLKENVEIVKGLLESKSIKMNDCFLYQHKAYINNMLKGKDILDKVYNFTTASLRYFFPFQAHNICDKKGIYIAENIENKNLIFLDIFAREYAVMLILGIMGSGKSFLTKNIIKNLADNGVEITILDKSGEYQIFKDEKNVIIHSNKTMKEYIEIIKKYNNQVNKDFINGKQKPRLFIVDELWAYINNNDFVNEYITEFSSMILEGRKKYMGVCFISQLIESLANNEGGQMILKASNLRFLMKMTANESKLIAKEFDLNLQQETFLTTAEHEGLLMVNSNCVQFKVQTTDERKIKYNTSPREREAAIDEV